MVQSLLENDVDASRITLIGTTATINDPVLLRTPTFVDIITAENDTDNLAKKTYFWWHSHHWKKKLR